MKTEHSKNRSAKQEYWQEHIRSWESSGLTQSSYCRENMLSLATFGYWRRKSSLKVSHEPQPRFFPLAVQSQVQEKQSSGFNTVRL
ncbi:IS66 family insertion sequence element accessory protein TnpA, partial [Desulfopila aestuarii]